MIRRSILDSSTIYYFNIISRKLIYKLFFIFLISFIITSYLIRSIKRYISLKKISLLIYLISITFKLRDLLLYKKLKNLTLTIFYRDLREILSVLIIESIKSANSSNLSSLINPRYSKFYYRY